jgi:hypothetical protein
VFRKIILHLVAPFAILVVALHWILQGALGAFLANHVFELLANYLGVEKAQMIAASTPYLIPTLLAGLGVYVAYAADVKERLTKPTPDIDARKAFYTALKDKRWLRHNLEIDPKRLKQLRADYVNVRLGNQIHDALAQSRLWAWGELSLRYGTGPSDRIPADKWHDVVIDFSPSNPELRTFATTRDGGALAYVDIRFSSAQFAKLFRIKKRLQ